MSWLSQLTGVHVKVPVLSQLGGVADAIGGSVIPGYEAIGKGIDALTPQNAGGVQTPAASNGSGLTLADLLKIGGSAAQGYANYSQNAQQLKQQADEFNKTYGLQQANTEAGLQSQLNRAPLADKGQYLALNAAPPTPFHPRDYTQGLDQLRQPVSGGAAAQLAANAQAASNYAPGAGGVDTTTLQALLKRLG